MSDVADIEARLRAAAVSDVDTKALRALLARATQGPWEAAAAMSGRRDGTVTTDEWFVRREGDDVSIAAEVLDPNTCKPSRANADLIVAAVNALPGLLDEVERLREQVAAERGSISASLGHGRSAHPAVLAEREACAALCDRTEERWREQERSSSDDFTRSRCFARADVAAMLALAIRARGGR